MDDLERDLQRSLTTIRDEAADSYPRTTWELRADALDRIRRRRARRYVVTGAVAAAAVAVTLYVAARPADLDKTEELPLTGTPSVTVGELDYLQPTGVTEVGAGPRDLSIGGVGRIWTANSDETISRINVGVVDATSFVATSTPGDIAIARGPVWVALPEEGSVVEVDPEAGPLDPLTIFESPVDRMELTVGDGILWVVARGEELVAVEPAVGTTTSVELPSPPVDVAIHEDKTWVATADGSIVPIDLTSLSGSPALASVPASAAADLTYANGALWYSSGEDGNLLRIDPTSGDVTTETFDGVVVDLAIDPQVAWVLLRKDDSTSWLQRVDRDTGTAMTDPRPIVGAATEVAIAHGSLWVTLTDRAEVARFPKT
jgi:streptogramin lyase